MALRSQPFARALAMMALVREAMGLQDVAARRAAMAEIEPYVSRGKGRGNASRNYMHGSPSKYKPHQGKREIARRLSRIQQPA